MIDTAAPNDTAVWVMAGASFGCWLPPALNAKVMLPASPHAVELSVARSATSPSALIVAAFFTVASIVCLMVLRLTEPIAANDLDVPMLFDTAALPPTA